MARYGWRFGWWLAVALPVSAWAQTPMGDGLQGTYYDGHNFEQYVSTRRDATINFDWNGQNPVAGLAAEQFSVRWTGWLVPPITGRYVLHISVDDGIRLWLNGRQLLDEWRGQALSYYQLAVDLKAGEPYPLRIDYCQYSYSTRMRLAWEPPPAPAAEDSWRNLWGFADKESGPVVIATRYLFSRSPTSPPAPPPVAKAAPTPISPPKPAELPSATASVLVVQPAPLAPTKPRPRSYLATVASRPLAPTVRAKVDSNRVSVAATRLAEGKAVTLRALYFEQGKAFLLPTVQASLDTLAQALATRPGLRLEVQGHTDNQGDPAINQQLSQQRATAVCLYLASHGVAAGRLRAVGYGGSRPVADNTQPDQRPRNRRVVLKPLGTQPTVN
jgi:outer membrane protein OmpA-like peptidoglycan-associated protein